MKKIRVGIVGCGAIGSALAKYCIEKLKDSMVLQSLFDINKKKAKELKEALAGNVEVAHSLDGLIERSDLVVEAASIDVSSVVLEKTIEKEKDAVIISVGGLIGQDGLLQRARNKGCRVYIPSGAVIGLDGIRAAAAGKIDEIVLTTKKPVAGLRGAPYIEKKRIDLDSLKTETLIFEGSAEEAIRAFPKNVNVSATLSLAGIGAKKTKVRIFCSPAYKRNVHEIELKGQSGRFLMKAENVPSPENPKTSYLAVLSAMATLKGIADSVRVGT